MNCHEFIAILDQGHAGELSGEAQAHASACSDCGEALAAAHALAADPVPPLRPVFAHALLDALDAPLAPKGTTRMRWRPAAALGALAAVGGIVFAGVALLTSESSNVPAETDAGPSAAATSEPATPKPAPDDTSLVDYVAAAEREAYREFTSTLARQGSYPEGEYFPVLKVGAIYPPSAANRALEGYAVVEFTVTPEGDVANPTIVSSSHPAFEAASIEAAERFKYKPRVENGRAVAVEGVRNRITFVLESSGEQPPAPNPLESDDVPNAMPPAEFRSLLAPALQCLRVSDLRCVELELDEIAATHELGTAERADLDRIYGFIHFRRGNYQQAIEAYERSTNGGLFPHRVTDMTVARIHYELAQYQQALDAALRYLRSAPSPIAADWAFVDRLRQLGATPR